MKISNLVPTVVLATRVLASFISGNASSEMHRETAGHVDDASTRWPIVTETPPRGRNMVRYCFTTLEVKTRFETRFLQAIDLWMTALGGPASPETGHNLAFREFRTPEGDTALCCLGDLEVSDRGKYFCKWNTAVENDVLAIFPTEVPRTSFATVGYLVGSKEQQLGSDRHPHRMYLHLMEPNFIHVWAHEVGHVLGLLHEHQRIDRDDHIRFQCRSLRDFPRCFAAAQRDRDERNTRDSDEELERKLCESWAFAKSFRFFSTAFMKGMGGDPEWEPVAHGPYDLDSIMHYSSGSGANYDPDESNACPQAPEKCPVVARHPTDPMVFVTIPDNTIPSAGDVAVVKRLYPFRT